MKTGRLEAFSDGVMAIIITIMVLELKVPAKADLASLQPILPTFFAYLLSFIYVGIYWNNHHHLFHVIKVVNGKILWANLFLLFCLSLFPVVTAWIGEEILQTLPLVFYGAVLFLAAIAYKIIVHFAIQQEGGNSEIAKVFNNDWKLKVSLLVYLSGIVFAYFLPIVSIICYISVAVIWFIPEKKIEKLLI